VSRLQNAVRDAFRWGFRAALWSSLAVASFGAFYLLFAWGVDAFLGDSRERAEAEVARQRQEIRLLEATAARLSEFQEALERNEQRLEQLARVLPDTPGLEGLEEELRTLGAESGVRIEGVASAEPRVLEFHAALPLDLIVTGSRAGLSDYVQRVRRQERLIHLEGIQAERREGTSRCLLRIVAFQYRERAQR
jgi:Tfp pilus assembly protein PilO